MLNGFLKALGIEDAPDTLRKLDKLAKIGREKVSALLREKLSETQAEQMLKLSEISAPDASFADVVKLGIYVLDVAYLPAVRAARDAVIDISRPPASTAVQVAALFAPGYLLEVEAWALAD